MTLQTLLKFYFFITSIDSKFEFTEEFCALQSMKGTTTAENLFMLVSASLSKLNLSLEKLRSVTTDGARNMVGSKTGVVARIRKYTESGCSTSHAVLLHYPSASLVQ